MAYQSSVRNAVLSREECARDDFGIHCLTNSDLFVMGQSTQSIHMNNAV